MAFGVENIEFDFDQFYNGDSDERETIKWMFNSVRNASQDAIKEWLDENPQPTVKFTLEKECIPLRKAKVKQTASRLQHVCIYVHVHLVCYTQTKFYTHTNHVICAHSMDREEKGVVYPYYRCNHHEKAINERVRYMYLKWDELLTAWFTAKAEQAAKRRAAQQDDDQDNEEESKEEEVVEEEERADILRARDVARERLDEQERDWRKEEMTRIREVKQERGNEQNFNRQQYPPRESTPVVVKSEK